MPGVLLAGEAERPRLKVRPEESSEFVAIVKVGRISKQVVLEVDGGFTDGFVSVNGLSNLYPSNAEIWLITCMKGI